MVISNEKLKENNNCNNELIKCEGIVINNISDGEILTYSLGLIEGKGPILCSYINIRGPKNVVREWPIISGEFRILVDLIRGENKLELEAGGYKKQLTLIYKPRITRYRVTPIYVICSGHNGYFQGPINENKSPESAATRIGLGARLLQSLTAEKMNDCGFGRKTFQLERDLDGPECLVMHSRLNVDTARAMNQRELWELIGRELMTGPLASRDRKYLAFLSCTRYKGAPNPRTHEATLASTQGHAALGGGGLALFGSACLHTWPINLNQVLHKFLDTTIIDTDYLMDDSNYRGTHGGCLATTLGSVLHELGHTFDLGHTRDGIMGRGFNYVDKIFIGNNNIIIDNNNYNQNRRNPQHTTISLTRPLSITVTIQKSIINDNNNPKRGRLLSETSTLSPISIANSTSLSKSKSKSYGRLSAPASPEVHRTFANTLSIIQNNSQVKSDGTFWTPSCATILAYHRWFNNTDDVHHSHNKNDIQYNPRRNVVRSSHGIRIIELRETSSGMVVNYRQFLGVRPPSEALVPPPPPNCFTPLTLFVENSVGDILKSSLPTAF